MIKKQIVIIGSIIILIILELCGCTSTKQTIEQIPEDLIIGNWYTEVENISINFQFYKNHSVCGTVQGMSVWSTYELTGNQIIFKNSDGSTSTSEYSFTNNNQTMTIHSQFGSTMILTKQ